MFYRKEIFRARMRTFGRPAPAMVGKPETRSFAFPLPAANSPSNRPFWSKVSTRAEWVREGRESAVSETICYIPPTPTRSLMFGAPRISFLSSALWEDRAESAKRSLHLMLNAKAQG